MVLSEAYATYFQVLPANSFHEELVFFLFSFHIRFTMGNILFFIVIGAVVFGVLFIIEVFWVMTKYFSYDWRQVFSYITLIDPHSWHPCPSVISRSFTCPSYNKVALQKLLVQTSLTFSIFIFIACTGRPPILHFFQPHCIH
jgi:hypothetical protein